MYRFARATFLAGVIAAGLAPMPAFADVLITEAEAKYPNAANFTVRGAMKGPGIQHIQQISLAADAGVQSPLPFRIQFIPRSDAPVDLASVRVSYLKMPMIDLTNRIKKHLSAAGIDMTQAEVPAGVHTLLIQVKDTQGRESATTVTLTVAPK